MLSCAFPDNYIIQSELALAPIFPILANSVLSRIPNNIEKNLVIDLGGGTGQWLEEMIKSGFKHGILLDLDYDILVHAIKTRNYVDRMIFINANVESIPIISNICNLVISRNSMHLWNKLDLAFSEIARITKVGGYLFIGRGFGPDLPQEIREKVKSERKKIRKLDETILSSSNLEYNAGEKESPPIEKVVELCNKYRIECLQIIPDNKSWWLLGIKT